MDKVLGGPNCKCCEEMYNKIHEDQDKRLEKMFNDLFRPKNLKDGEPCGHPGCLHHITHPCEGCGRIGGVK